MAEEEVPGAGGPGRHGEDGVRAGLVRGALNCARLVAVNLRDYKPFEHKVVLWDEASPELVLTNRKLFQ